MGYRRSRRRRVLRVLFARSKFLCFDAAITLSGDLDCKGGVAKAIKDGVCDDRVRNHLAPMVQGKLGGKHDGLVARSFLQDLTQILSLGGGQFPAAHFIKNDEVELGELVAITKVTTAGAREIEMLEPLGDAGEHDGLAAGK